MRLLNLFSCCLFALVVTTSAAVAEPLSADVQGLISKARAGEAEAQFRVGTAYDFGRGVSRDGAEAMKWYRLAADQGHVEAQNSVGSRLQAEKRYAEALPWYERASAQGHALATNNLAYFYDMGLGVKQDRRKGFELYSRAADLGWAEAMWNIANMYGAGQLGQPDLVMACAWTVRARKYAAPTEQQLIGHTARVMPQLEKMLSSEQLATCRQQGESWSPQSVVTKSDAQPGSPPDAQAARR